MAKGRVSFNTEHCKACELCVNFCPKNILMLDKTRINVLGYHPISVTEMEKCTGCALCAVMCPDMVIVVERA
ncbi:MAG: 4Fe-4S binding protein [Syntrophomonadaceae bacterium]|nr:4Fe-4S binding protein [Syntrophomonadaceae bacterium]